MVLTVAMVCSIPLYTNGILQRMLLKDLENYQQERNQYPGKYEARLELYQNYSSKEGQQYKTYNFFANRIQGEFLDDIGLETVASRRELQMGYLHVTPEEIYGKVEDAPSTGEIVGLQGLFEHAELTSGRLPSAEIKDGIIECVIFSQIQKTNDIILDKVYILEDFSRKYEGIIKIKPVGIIVPKNEADPWWVQMPQYYDTFLIDYDYMLSHFLYENEAITRAQWLYQYDYTKISIEEIENFVNTINLQNEWYEQYSGIKMTFRSLPIFEEYFVRAQQLTLTLWVLQSPILIMLAFYIFMVAQLVVENDSNEISILKSRGSSRAQILMVYLLQSAVLALAACVIGPFLGILICKVLGSSNGFLEFVARTALPIKMTPNALFYSLIAGVFSVFVIMIPVFKASKVSIVELKQKKSRKWNAPLWQKMFLDVILLGLSLYGLNDYLRQGQTRLVVEQAGSQMPLDPFMFIILTLFVLGAGLLFLRIYPLIVKAVLAIGKKLWPPTLYSSFIHVSRTSGREQFLMLFLVLTVSVGIFSANSTRTINQNIEDRVYYNVGSDMKMQIFWRSNESSMEDTMSGQAPSSYGEEKIIYIEPPFSTMSNIEDTEYAAKVLRAGNANIRVDSESENGEVMAIDPYDFGKVVWQSDNFLSHHINEYLNLMSYSPNAVIVSKAFATEYGLVTGDTLSYTWSGQQYMEGVIVAFAEYWPGINPNESEDSRFFIVSNLSYVQLKTATEPYEVWFKNSEDASTKTIYESIEENNLTLEWIEVAKQELVTEKNDPMLQGINGAMTLSFVVTMTISMVGFIIYWILSIKSRVLQFGIFRAMGMTKKNVLTMLAFEQILISLAAIVMGIVIGGLSCRLFMPLLQVLGTAAEQVPPFRLVAARQDYIKLYTVVSVMIVGGFAFIGWMVSKIKIAQVIKLGED